MDFHKPEVLNIIAGNLANNYKQFKEEVLIYFEATETDKKSNKVQVARLKNLLGSEALKLYNPLKDAGEDETVMNILNVLEKHCIPKKNETMAIHLFLSRRQLEGESFNKFYIDLKSLIRPCAFEDQENKILRSQIVMGIFSSFVKERLLREYLSLEKVVQLCRGVEAAEDNMKIMMKNQSNQIRHIDEVAGSSKQQTQKPKSIYCTFIVVDSEKATPIIGLKSSVSLGLIKRLSVNSVKVIPDVGTFIERNKDVFLNQGCFSEVLKLRLKEGAVPTSSPARRVPNKISDRLKLKLDSLESRKIIEKCESGEWVHNLVIVEKHKTGDER